MPTSDNAILRQLKSHVRKQRKIEPLRAIAIDDWSWRKGFRYGTIVVDLERRTVADVLKTRSADGTTDWLKQHPGIEFVSRDRCGLYAQGIRQGAPAARQAADRHEVVRRRSQLYRQALFVNAKRMHVAGRTFGDIAAEIGADRRTIAKWVSLDDLPDRQRSAIKPSSPLYFQEFLERRWAAGDRSGRRLFHDVRNRGYIGSFSHLERLLSTWRKGAPGQTPSPPPPAKVEPLGEAPAIDPTTGWRISPMVAASLCMKPTPTLTPSEAAKVGALKEGSPSFVVMRRLAMRFRGLLQGANPSNLDRFLHDARRSRLSSMQQFARTLTRDTEAVKHAIAEPWSSGQAEGQINRLKTLKRAMYGRASIELLRARMLPFQSSEHEK